MKSNRISLCVNLTLVLLLTLNLSKAEAKSELESLAESQNKFRKGLSRLRSKTVSRNTLHQNALRLMHLEKEKVLMIRLRFMWKQAANNDPNLALNKFDYKAVKIDNEHIVIFESEQNTNEVNESNCTAEHYLMTIKLQNIDLPCNDNLYICSVGELRSEYQRKMEGVDFGLDQDMVKEASEEGVENKCLAITVGPFNNMSEIAYLCFDTDEDYIFYSNLISERVFTKQNKFTYDGQLELLNEKAEDAECTKGLQGGILSLEPEEMVFSNGVPKFSKNYKKFFSLPYKNVMGYANVLYNREKLPWQGAMKDKPSEYRCFKFSARLVEGSPPSNLYFCTFNKRLDWGGKREKLPVSQSIFVNDMWVAALNMKLHSYNLSVDQEKLRRTVGSIDCNAHIMESVKFEIRLRYMIMRHKIKQLTDLKKLEYQLALKLVELYKKNIISAACVSVELCVKGANLCMDKGFLNLTRRGFQIAWSLQNPYVTAVPKLGIAVREYPKNSIGMELVKEAESLTGLKPTKGRIVPDISKYKNKEVPSTIDLKRAFNTFKFFFGGQPKKVQNIEYALKYILSTRNNGSLNSLKRKVNILTFEGPVDPFYEYLGHLRNRDVN